MNPSAADSDALLPDGQPDWERIEFEPRCARCDYSLRYLTQPRCPECGLEFTWSDVFDAVRRRSPFLFEHHWRKRPIRSYLVTIWRSLRPWSFWHSVSIHEHVNLRPLLFLYFCAVPVFVLVLHGTAFALSKASRAVRPLVPSGPPIAPSRVKQFLRIVEQTAGDLAGFPFDSAEYLFIPAALLVFLLATTALLCSLRQTLGRCRVRTRQVFRVVTYAATPAFFIQALLVNCLLVLVALGQAGLVPESGWFLVIAMYPVIAAIPVIHLGAGLKRYLHLPRAFLLAFTAVLVAGLFTVTYQLWLMHLLGEI